jgi:membrane protein DedA with SNARE-associated domain
MSYPDILHGEESIHSAMYTLILSNQHWLAKAGGYFSVFLSSIGGLGVALLAVADSSFISLPEGNDLLIVVLSTGGSWGNMAYFVGMTTLGSVLGCLLLYMLGRKGGNALLRRRFSERNVERAEGLFEKYGMLTVVIPSILPPPLPFKIFVLSAGVFRLNTAKFLTAVVIGRTLRYSMWGILAVLYGNSVKRFMEQNLDAVGLILFGLFAAGITCTLIYFLFRKLKRHRFH